VVVFRAPPGTPYSRQVWAPELQRIRGRWVIHFAASDGDNANHRMYALVARGDDPQGRWELKGRVAERDDSWAIDGVVLELRGRLYFVWSGWPGPTGDFPQLLYIAAMRDPWTIVGERHAIAAPELDWERAVAPIVEAPQPLRRGGSTFIVYSAAASWSDDYALGVLTYGGGDPLSAQSWRKDPLPAFAKDAARGVFGVGHPTFVPSPDGREDWLVYHAIDRAGGGWSARSVRAQRFAWRSDGRPSFGVPIAVGVPLDAPSGTAGEQPRTPSRERSRTRGAFRRRRGRLMVDLEAHSSSTAVTLLKSSGTCRPTCGAPSQTPLRCGAPRRAPDTDGQPSPGARSPCSSPRAIGSRRDHR
jgi:GH43 family beta-xylosidase